MFAHIEIRPRRPEAPLSGNNILVLKDGKEIPGLSKLTFEVGVGELAKLTTEQYVTLDLSGILDVDPIENEDIKKTIGTVPANEPWVAKYKCRKCGAIEKELLVCKPEGTLPGNKTHECDDRSIGVLDLQGAEKV